ncbi:DNA-binding protein [Natrialba sp. SSL1]|uniref:DNA-binding protein n=1 Tax=Natrialba sp. SSL1 TaxID=1869245 RepID=UPI0008F8D0CF|nr:DNA-binding protein [Natrialba sp. SSL1]OIB58854.1 DNA-binding protein [Natrialba sp. SSL1]
MRFAVRLGITLVLLLTLLGLGIHYGATYDENWPHPSGDQLQEDYGEFTGDHQLVFGEVQSISEDTMTIHVTDSADEVAAELEITHHDATDRVDPGGLVQVYGVLESDRTMAADELVVVNEDDTAEQYKLLTSIVGVLLAIAYFFRYWKLTLTKFGFEPRPNKEETQDD